MFFFQHLTQQSFDIVFFFVNSCFCSNGGGPPGSGVPVHHNTRGYRSAAVLSGPEPDLPVRSAILEETSQPHEGENVGKLVGGSMLSLHILHSYCGHVVRVFPESGSVTTWLGWDTE